MANGHTKWPDTGASGYTVLTTAGRTKWPTTGATGVTTTISGRTTWPAGASDVVWPSTPFAWFSANNINGLLNVGVANNDPVGTWKNLGSSGTAWDLLQATGSAKPIFKLQARAAMNRTSAIRGDGVNAYMLTAVNSTQAQPAIWCVVAQSASWLATLVIESGSSSNRNQIYHSANSAVMYAGAGPTFGALVDGKCHTLVADFNGASSSGRVDATASGTINASTAGFDQISAFSGPPHPGNLFAGDIYQIACWTGAGRPSAASIVSSITAFYGATPQ